VDPVLVVVLILMTTSVARTLPLSLQITTELIIGLLTFIFFHESKVYQSYRSRSLWLLVARLTISWGKVVACLLAVAFLAKLSASISRTEFVSWVLVSWVILCVLHVGGHKLLRVYRSRGGNSKTLIFWGTSEQAISFGRQIKDLPYLGLKLVKWFGPNPPGDGDLPAWMPSYGGGSAGLAAWLRFHDVDQIYFSSTTDAGNDIQNLIKLFGNTCKPVYYVPSWANASMCLRGQQLGSSFSIELWGDESFFLQKQLKRIFDVIASITLILLLSPLLLVISIVILCFMGSPVLYSQDRYGLDGQRFKIYKFRSMSVVERGDEPGLRQARQNDLRVTPLGRFLRQWSLDELPQLFNVLDGSMSLVGPRPHAVAHNEYYRHLIPGYMQRHLLKPGITGLAQVKGFRGETSTLNAMAQRLEADLQYLKEWSLGLDLRILIGTLLKLRSPHAY
jgi:putative colanic acid biosynthesis UDP-glucose lipid carrier transferase